MPKHGVLYRELPKLCRSEYELELEFGERDRKLLVHYDHTPYRPARVCCSNDDACPPEGGFEGVTGAWLRHGDLYCEITIKDDKFWGRLNDAVEEKIIEAFQVAEERRV